VEVSFPDGSTRKFGYDSRDLMTSETDPRGFAKYRKFDSAGRLTEVVLEDTSRRFMSVAAAVGLLDPSSGVGLSKGTPAPMTVTEGTTTSVDAEGRSRAYEFNEFGAVTKFVNAASLETTMQYDANGNVLRIVRPSGGEREMTYDANNNLLTVRDEQLGGTTTYTYDPALNRLDSIKDANQKTTDIGYNPAGQITSTMTPLGRQNTMTYTPEGNLDTLSDSLGVQTSFEYYADGNLSKITRTADGQVRETTFINDAAGNGEIVTDAADRMVTSLHDSMNRVTSIQGPGTPTTLLGYDANGNNVSITPPSQPSHEFEYDSRDWLSSYQAPPAGTATSPMTFTRNAEGQETVVSLPDGRSISRGYDSAGRLTTTTIGGNREYVTEYDSTTGLAIKMTDPDGGFLTFGYEGDRQTRVRASDGTGTEYAYDALGRLAAVSVTAPQQTCEGDSGVVASYLANGDATDAVGGNDGYVETFPAGGDVIYVDGVEGQAFRFVGNERVRANVPMSGKSEATLSLWFRKALGSPNTTSGILLLPQAYVLWVDPPTGVRAGLYGFLEVEGQVGAPYYDGEWHQLVTTMDTDTLNVYFDGQLVASEAKGPVVLQPTDDIAIGNYGGAVPDLDMVTIYDEALSAEQVADLFNTQSPWTCVTGDTVSYAYDDDGAVTAAGDVSIGYDAATGLLETKRLAQLTMTRGHNGFGEVVSELTEAFGVPDALYDVTYVRDPLGRVSAKTETIGGQTHALEYEYDEVGRLVEVLQAPATVLESYTYDDNGNRLTATNHLGSFTASYDDQDRLIDYGPNQYAYLESGELLEKTHDTNGPTSYDYDELGNLLSVALPSGVVVDYEIDAMNRRAGRRVDGNLTHRWIYKDQLNPVAELDDQGNLTSLFIYGTRSHVPDGMVKNDVRYFFVTDQVGSVRLVVNAETGAVAQQIDYDAFGNVMQDSSPGFQPFGFAGGLYDGRTKLVRFGARDYDPEVGRWTATDPLLFHGGQGNLYVYVGNDPVNHFDPSGLLPFHGDTYLECLRNCKDDNEEGVNQACDLVTGVSAGTPPNPATPEIEAVHRISTTAVQVGFAATCIVGCGLHLALDEPSPPPPAPPPPPPPPDGPRCLTPLTCS
jgi:RHS repeat-associated protein